MLASGPADLALAVRDDPATGHSGDHLMRHPVSCTQGTHTWPRAGEAGTPFLNGLLVDHHLHHVSECIGEDFRELGLRRIRRRQRTPHEEVFSEGGLQNAMQ